MNYKQGEKTKQKILEVSKRLFYHQGIENTTYAQISNKAHVNMGLIIYHFGSKDNIASLIYKQGIKDRHEIYIKKIEQLNLNDHYDYVTIITAEYNVQSETYIRNPKYQRFISEVLSQSTAWESEVFDFGLDAIIKKYNLSLSEEERTLHKCLFMPYASCAANLINSKQLNINASQMCAFHTKAMLAYLNISEAETEKLITGVKQITDKIKVFVNEQFIFS